jgi:hypothetical protein
VGGLGVPAQAHQAQVEAVERLMQARIEGQGALITARRLVGPVGDAQGLAVGVMGGGVLRGQPGRLAQKADGVQMTARLHGHRAEQVDRGDVARLVAHHFLAKSGGAREITQPIGLYRVSVQVFHWRQNRNVKIGRQ